jgi:hypothetical protein
LWPYAAVALLAIGAITFPVHIFSRFASPFRAVYGAQVEGRGELTPGLNRGLTWVREHTPTDTVVAVNNQFITLGGVTLPANFYYSAFAERRVFLEGWSYTAPAIRLSNSANPFLDRLRLNEAVFSRADRAAFRLLVDRWSVRYLIVDKVHGSASPQLGSIARLVFDDSDCSVYAVS